MFGMKAKPLLQCEVVHSLPGRMRIGCRALVYLEGYSGEIENHLKNSAAIKTAKVNTLTGNILIEYSTENVTEDEVLEMVEYIVSSYSMAAYKGERQKKSSTTVQERRLQEESSKDIARRIAATGAILLYSVLRYRNRIPPASIVARFTSLPAIGSLALSIPLMRSGFQSMKTSLRPNADTLSATAVLASLVAGKDISALTTILLSDIAELLTAYTMERTRKAIRDMLDVGEEYVWKLDRDGKIVKIGIKELKTGDRVLSHTGEKISVDGVVEEGEAVVDQASITGEFVPAVKSAGSQVFAGTIVKSGGLTVRAEKIGDQTAAARIVHMVEEASNRKAEVQAYADRFSAQFIPLNFGLSLLVYLITKSSTRALNMLIIDYSCGVRLSTATALSASIYAAARNGILVKGGNYIEMLSKVDTLILDKTGTVTEGKPQVISMVPANSKVQPRDLVEMAAAAEEVSTHPMAAAVLRKVRSSGWSIPSHGETKIYTARGVETTIGKSLIRVGNRRFMEESGIDVRSMQEAAIKLMSRGESVVYVARNKRLAGILGIQDTLRRNMKKALNRLRMLGIDDIRLLTGDLEIQAEVAATRMAMDGFESELLPEDKAKSVLQLQSKGSKVLMVGDGINDAPALAYADIGIALGGSRTDIAMEAADITITGDDPLMIPTVVQLSRKTMRVVKENFATAIGVNTLGLVLASLGVLPVFMGALLHNLSTVAVVLNSARLLLYNTERR